MTACRVVTFEERASGCGAGSSRSAWRRLSLKSNPQAKCVKWADTTRCSEPQSITACAVGVFYRGIFLRADSADSGTPPTSPSFTDFIYEGASRRTSAPKPDESRRERKRYCVQPQHGGGRGGGGAILEGPTPCGLAVGTACLAGRLNSSLIWLIGLDVTHELMS